MDPKNMSDYDEGEYEEEVEYIDEEYELEEGEHDGQVEDAEVDDEGQEMHDGEIVDGALVLVFLTCISYCMSAKCRTFVRSWPVFVYSWTKQRRIARNSVSITAMEMFAPFQPSSTM